jgi:predicted nucleic acid-binding protein
MVVSNTSPLNYLILIEAIEVVPRLYECVIIPPSVYQELRAPETPEVVRSWIERHPDWLEISSETGSADSELASLHAGEREAISLALHLRADALLIDERQGRNEAERREMKVIGTIGVLVSAHQRGLLDIHSSLSRSRQTTFHVSPKLLASVLQRWSLLNSSRSTE